MPPEIYNSIENGNKIKKFSSLPNIMPWTADIYSYGIVGLCITREIIFEESNLQILDHFKLNESEHKKIIEICKYIDCKEDSLTQKMQYVLEMCLSFSPNQRIKFYQLYNIMK